MQAAASALPETGGQVAAETLADLAAASRILAAQGVVDGFGHVSMRHPAAPQRYLMSRSLAPALRSFTVSLIRRARSSGFFLVASIQRR